MRAAQTQLTTKDKIEPSLEPILSSSMTMPTPLLIARFPQIPIGTRTSIGSLIRIMKEETSGKSTPKDKDKVKEKGVRGLSRNKK